MNDRRVQPWQNLEPSLLVVSASACLPQVGQSSGNWFVPPDGNNGQDVIMIDS